MLNDAFDALLASEMLPVAFPALVGVKVAVKLALCPAWSTRGTLTPVNVNADPVGVIDKMVAATAPLFVSVMV
jgi:hypothetical protein